MSTPIKRARTTDAEHRELMSRISRLPHKILQLHHMDTLSQMVLHELGHDNCFGLSRAIYLIDNPDFDHLVGAAGYCKNECKCHKPDLWIEPESFSKDMECAHFHNDVRKFLAQSLKRRDINLNDSHDVQELGRAMGLQNPQFFSWAMKHDNHGLLLYEPEKNLCVWRQGLLNNASALLSLCGI